MQHLSSPFIKVSPEIDEKLDAGPRKSCTGLGFITSHGLREYEVKKLRSPAFCG